MSHQDPLINISRLGDLIQHHPLPLQAVAQPMNGDVCQGYTLHITDGEAHWRVSTYLSDKVKLYKRADALLNEAKTLGLPQVCFKL